MELSVETFSKRIRKNDRRKGTKIGIEGILLLLCALAWATTEPGLGSDVALGMQEEILAASGMPEVDVKRFEPLWSTFYAGPVDYSPDGRRIAVGVSSAVFVIDAKSYQVERQLFDHRELIYSVKWSPDGRYLASGSSDPGDTYVRIWEAESGQLISRIGWLLGGRITSIAWNPAGDRLAYAINVGGLIIWDLQADRLLRTLDGGSTVAWSPDGRHVVAGYRNGFNIYEVETGTLVRGVTAHPSTTLAVAWSPDGRYIASSGDFDLSVKVWDAATVRLITTLDHGWVKSVDWTADGSYLATGGGSVKVWEAGQWTLIRTLDAEQGYARSVSWGPDRNLVAGGEGILKAWDVETSALIADLRGQRNDIEAVAWSPDGRYVVSGTNADPFGEASISLKVWDGATGAAVRTLCEGGLSCWTGSGSLDWSPDGRYIASGGSSVVLWDAETGEEVIRYYLLGGGVRWSPDGKYLASIYGRVIYILEVETGEIATIEVQSTQNVLSVAWSPDGKYLASSGSNEDTTVRVWAVGTWEPVAVLPGLGSEGIRSLTWSPDGRYVAGVQGVCCVEGVLQVWELETGKVIQMVDGMVMTAAWSPDGRYLVSGGVYPRTTVRILEAGTGALLRTLRGHTRQVAGVSWSPDGRYIASVSWDRTVRLWGQRREE